MNKQLKKLWGWMMVFLETTSNIAISIIHFQSIFSNSKNEHVSTKRSVVVAMNGPTLKDDISELELEPGEVDFVCANHLADMDLFAELKPSSYVFSDPYFFSSDASKDLVDAREKTFCNICSECDWDMTVFAPSRKAWEFLRARFTLKGKIKVVRFNGLGAPADYNSILGFLWDQGFCAPPGNVLVQCLYLAVRSRCETIYLVGANWSFHESIYVDQNTNDFYKIRKHAYGTSKELGYTDWRKVNKSNVEQEFYAIYVGFRELRALSAYASYKGVKVINCTKKSFLDMFPRGPYS